MKSVWTETWELPCFECLQNDINVDVLVIGGGMAGILCGYMLEKSGIHYALVEKNRICSGITKNTTAKILTDMVMGRETPYASVFSPSRSIIHPQLAVNTFEAIGNLLTLSGKRCPHMGCALKWNPQENSWDCPCHGSRFTSHGELIDNPASGDLKK